MSFGTARLDLRQLVGSLRSIGAPGAPGHSSSAAPTWPFVTISRQAGISSSVMSHALADHLNRRDTSGHPWQTFDEELVQRIAADHHLSADLIHSLETSSHTWMTEFFQGLAHSDNGTPTDMAIIRRVAETTRGLARAGHVILAGLGGVLITRDFPAAIHVRIIASFEWRVQHLAAAENLSDHDARARVKLLDNDRAAFFGRFWPGIAFDTELFHMTLNAGLMSESQMADCVAAAVHERMHAHK